MAHVTHDVSAPHGLASTLAAPFVGLFKALIAISEANPRYRKLQRLQAMSDDELAKLGLRRDEIVQHVLQGSNYL